MQENKTSMVGFKLTATEKKMLQDLVGKRGVSNFCREAVLKAMKKKIKGK